MALRSSAECFNSIMNGEGLDEDTPSIDVEINVIQKEVEAEESASELNSEEQKVLKLLDNIDTACNIVDEAEMLINILKEDGINPLALKILSTNKIYTDVWKIGFPSTESLDVVGSNKYQADQIAAALEEKKKETDNIVVRMWRRLMEIIKSLVNKWFGKAEEKALKLEEIINKLKNVKEKDVDEEAIKERTISAFDVQTATDLRKKVDECVDKIITTARDVAKSSVDDIDAIVRDLNQTVENTRKDFDNAKEENLSGSDLVKAVLGSSSGFLGRIKTPGLIGSVKDTKEMKKKMDNAIKELEAVITKIENKSSGPTIKSSVLRTVKAGCSQGVTIVTNLYKRLQDNYIALAMVIVNNLKEKKSLKQRASDAWDKAKEAVKKK